MLRPEPATSLLAGRFAQTLFNKVGAGSFHSCQQLFRPAKPLCHDPLPLASSLPSAPRITPFPADEGL
jgi:hypothetical protein